MEKLIHIHAKCNSFEISEQIPENKTIKRLTQIKNLFNYTGDIKTIFGKKKRMDSDKLSVSTIVVNPELPFK